MSKLITDRFSIIKKYIKNKEVLDIGCIDHYSEREIKNLWIHKKIKTYAKSLIGVDLIKKEVDKLNNKGYDIICDNAETFNLNKKFDIIFAGELIEHINNQGLFLENVRKHLKDDGKFIFTTPNCNNFFNTIEVLLFGQTPVNDEHVLWHN
ncbi:MAG: methyltransferase domain-containing protein, partial [Lutibacter sp.]|nr:methyltransferase domain-containing protein [Lutibacter sp.]